MEETEAGMPWKCNPKKHWLSAVFVPGVLKSLVSFNFQVKHGRGMLFEQSVGDMLKAQWQRKQPKHHGTQDTGRA